MRFRASGGAADDGSAAVATFSLLEEEGGGNLMPSVDFGGADYVYWKTFFKKEHDTCHAPIGLTGCFIFGVLTYGLL